MEMNRCVIWLGLWANGHGMVEYVVGIVLAFDLLQKRIKPAGAVVVFRPVGASKHVLVGIIAIAAIVMVVRIRRANVFGIRVRTGEEIGVELGEPLAANRIIFRFTPEGHGLHLDDGRTLINSCRLREGRAVDSPAV